MLWWTTRSLAAAVHRKGKPRLGTLLAGTGWLNRAITNTALVQLEFELVSQVPQLRSAQGPVHLPGLEAHVFDRQPFQRHLAPAWKLIQHWVERSADLVAGEGFQLVIVQATSGLALTFQAGIELLLAAAQFWTEETLTPAFPGGYDRDHADLYSNHALGIGPAFPLPAHIG